MTTPEFESCLPIESSEQIISRQLDDASWVGNRSKKHLCQVFKILLGDDLVASQNFFGLRQPIAKLQLAVLNKYLKVFACQAARYLKGFPCRSPGFWYTPEGV